MDGEIFSREALLIGEEALAKLKGSRVIVFGLGGVGGAAFEALVRAGVGRVDAVDPDTVSKTNLNRQLLAVSDTVGCLKADAAKARAAQIAPSCEVTAFPVFYSAKDRGGIVLEDYDFILDAIDTVSSKLLLIEEAAEKNIPIICSMGTGNKLFPERLTVSDIYKTNTCPLAAVIRRECRRRGIKKLPVVWSDEEPHRVSEDAHGRHAPGSISFVPPVAGYIMAGYAVRHLVGE